MSYNIILLLVLLLCSSVTARILLEYRIPLPFSVDEFRIGQRYTVYKYSLMEATDKRLGLQIVINEERSANEAKEKMPNANLTSADYVRYAMKVYYVDKYVPRFVRLLSPNGRLVLFERSWNAYPYTHTEYSNDYMRTAFYVTVDTVYKSDRCDSENALNLSSDKLKIRKIINIDIAIDRSQDDPRFSPNSFRSNVTNRGPLTGNWAESVEPYMCVYKSVDIKFKWYRLQNEVEKIIQKSATRLNRSFYRRAFVWMDEWYNLSYESILSLERQQKKYSKAY